jgi:hypothetical protein
MAHGFADEFQPVEDANGREDVSRIGALAPTRFEEAALAHSGQQGLEQQLFACPATSRVRNSLSTVWVKPGSVNSKLKAYFQSIRLRTASAAWRSDNPSANCMTVVKARRHGDAAGWPRAGNKGANS